MLKAFAVALLAHMWQAAQAALIKGTRQGYLRASPDRDHSGNVTQSSTHRNLTEIGPEWALLPMQLSGDGWFLNNTEAVKTFPAPFIKNESQGASTAHTRLHNVSEDSSQHASDGQPSGRVFFLFMTMSGIENEAHWQAFFNGVDWSMYRIFISCKFHDECSQKLASWNPLGLTLVDFVPSYYCVDLVSPMVQLLAQSVAESASHKDKFVFISESTLPVKPFSVIYNDLMWYQQSDFCVGPSHDWQQMHLQHNYHRNVQQIAYLVKHSQWMVLTPHHAHQLIKSWPSVKQGNQWSIPIWHAQPANSHANGFPENSSVLPRGSWNKDMVVCADEWAIFGSIYGAVVDEGHETIGVPGFSTNILRLNGHSVQGSCRTFVFWGEERYGYYSQDGYNLVRQIIYDVATLSTCHPTCSGSHPGTFHLVSDRTALAMRHSKFHFVRKFEQNALTLEQFTNIILQ